MVSLQVLTRTVFLVRCSVLHYTGNTDAGILVYIRSIAFKTLFLFLFVMNMNLTCV